MADIVDERTGLILKEKTPDLFEDKNDIIPPVDRGDETGLDEEHLKSYIFSAFKDIVAKRYDYGWIEKKNYSLNAYYGVKNEAMKNWPHENASAFPVPLTPTLMDTAWANVQAGLFYDRSKVVRIEGVGDEDVRPAGILQKFQNWQMVNEMRIEHESDKNIFRAFLHGVGVYKVIFDIKTGNIKIRSIDIENFHVPIDASGLQRGETDIIIHLIPLSWNDLQLRKAMKVYRDPNSIVPGASLLLQNSEELTHTLDTVSGMSMAEKVSNSNYYIAEVDLLGYIPPDAYRSIDLKVWVSPKGMTIQRIRKMDKAMKTPYAAAHCYPYADRWYSMSFPEKIRNEQEKIDYADKQYTDSLDIGSMPAMFVDDTDTFQRGRMQRVRGGIYPKGKGNTIEWEPQPTIDRASASERALIWEMAERKTGVIDITQGRPSSFGGKTLGEVEIRTSRADVRFSMIFNRFGRQLNEVSDIVYELNYLYTSKKKIVDVVGYSSEGYEIDELFPVKDGELVKHNFEFTGRLEMDRKEENDKKMAFLDSQMTSMLVSGDVANTFNVSQEMANIVNIRNFSQLVRKPKDSKIVTVEEFIQRIISGDTNVQIRPGIDADDFVFELQLFKRNRIYNSLEDFQKKLIDDGLRRAYMMGVAERKAKMLVQGLMSSQFSTGSPGGLPEPEGGMPQAQEGLPEVEGGMSQAQEGAPEAEIPIQ